MNFLLCQSAPGGFPLLPKCSAYSVSFTQTTQLDVFLFLGHILCSLYLFCSDAANSVSSPPIMPFTDFYNITLDHIDFMEEYRIWQNYGNSNRSDLLSHCWIFHPLGFSAEGVQTETVFFPVGKTNASQGLG